MFRRSMAILVFAALAAGALGCGEKREDQAQAAKSQTDAAQEHAVAQISAALETQLAKADAVDGAADHVVANCSGCKLKMAGSPNYTSMMGNYTLRFCSTTCKDKMAQGGEEALLALQIPEAAGHEDHGH